MLNVLPFFDVSVILHDYPQCFQRMHDYAEHGLAAHWLYKETGSWLPSASNMGESESSLSKDLEDSESVEGDLFQKYGSLKAGHPVLRVEGSQLLAAVIIRYTLFSLVYTMQICIFHICSYSSYFCKHSVDKGGKELLVAVSFGLAASEAVADRRSSFQTKRWEAYANLYKKVQLPGLLSY